MWQAPEAPRGTKITEFPPKTRWDEGARGRQEGAGPRAISGFPLLSGGRTRSTTDVPGFVWLQEIPLLTPARGGGGGRAKQGVTQRSARPAADGTGGGPALARDLGQSPCPVADAHRGPRGQRRRGDAVPPCPSCLRGLAGHESTALLLKSFALAPAQAGTLHLRAGRAGRCRGRRHPETWA